MDKNNGFALVRKPSSAVEKSAPGAKRILSGMVLETLATVRKASPLKIVHVDDEYWLSEMIGLEIRKLAKEHRWLNEVRLKQFQDGELAWQELLREEPDLLITDVVRGASLRNGQRIFMRGYEMLPLLAERKVKYPILVASGYVEEKDVRFLAGSNLNISFLKKPFTSEQFYKELSSHLGSKLQFH